MSKRIGYCSFCRKTYQDVGPLVEGPDEAHREIHCVPPARVHEVGDLWEGLRTSPGIDLSAALENVHKRHGR